MIAPMFRQESHCSGQGIARVRVFAAWLAALIATLVAAGRNNAGEPTGAPRKSQSTLQQDHRDEIVCGLAASESKPSGNSLEFVIASYNVQTRPVLDRPETKLPLISPLLNAFDVVLIQECFNRHDLLWSEANLPNKVYFGRLAAAGRLANSGLSVLTRLPMGETVMEHFRAAGDFQNQLASKGILLVRMVAAGVPLDVYDTHMVAGETSVVQRARHEQARQVVDFVTKHSPADHAVILMGDFNMGPLRKGKPWAEYPHFSNETDMASRTAEFEYMRQTLELRDAADEAHGATDHGIERLLFREGTQCRMEVLACDFEVGRFQRPDGSRLSDGWPLVARMRLTKRQ